MSKSHNSDTPNFRRSSRRLSHKRRLQVETLECRALLTVSFTNAYGIGGQNVSIAAVATDSSGDVYVTGSYKGAANFGTGYSSTGTPNTNYDAFVVKYSPAGAVLWYSEFYSDSTDPESTSGSNGIAYDAANSTVYVVGNFSGTVNFNNFPPPSSRRRPAAFRARATMTRMAILSPSTHRTATPRTSMISPSRRTRTSTFYPTR